MTIAQIISLTLILAVLLSYFYKERDLLSPARIFILIWSFIIILTEFKFSRFQHEWSAFGWFILILSLVSFAAGCYIAYVIYFNKPLLSIETIRNRVRKTDPKDLHNLFYITIILFILYVFAFILEVMIEGYVPLFSARVDKARVEFGVFGLHLLVNFQLIIMFMNLEYIILAGKEFKWNKIVMWGIFFFTLLSFGLLLQRFSYFFGAVMAFALFYYASRLIKFRWVLLISGVFFGFLAFIQSIRLSQYVSQFFYVISRMKYSKEYAILTEPYMYITMNLENAARATTKLENYTYSTSTLDWLYALFGLKHWIIEYFNIIQRPFLNSGYNTYPFFWPFYYDFGVAGVAILSLLTGLVIAMCYYKMRVTGELKWVAMYSTALAVIVISFFTNPLTMLIFAANITMLWLIHHFFLINTRKPE